MKGVWCPFKIYTKYTSTNLLNVSRHICKPCAQLEKMERLKLLLIILGIGIIIKIGLYQICKKIDKGFTNHSSTLIESKSNNFFIENYQLVEVSKETNHELSKELNLISIFVENNWDYKCPILGTKKIPTKVNGQNIVLSMKVQNLESLDKLIFYLATENDTMILRGNRTIETAYYNKTWNNYEELSNSELLLKDKKGKLATRFKLKKEK